MAMKPIFRTALLLAAASGCALAQTVVAPTPETVGSARGKNWDDYNITNSFEVGYRFADVSGNDGKYRSDENYRNGVRLLSGSFSANSKDGHGWLFDEILLNTQGLGGDPYESASLRIQKNRLYRYDMLWRLDEYYNPALSIDNGSHFRNTSHRLLDNDFVLFPQSKIQFRLGYSRNDQDGPALSTVQLFNARGDIFTPFMNVKRIYNEYRIGNDIEVAGFKFTWMRAWNNFREDSTYLAGADLGQNPTDNNTLQSLYRADPLHGNSPLWRGNLHGERKLWALNARITYVGAQRNYAQDETAIGFNPSAINLQTLVSGSASRPTTAGDFSISFFPTERISIVNNTSVYTTRISGDSAFLQVNNALEAQNLLFFQFLGIRTITNSTDITFRISPMVSLFGGYHYSTREIRSIENLSFPDFPGPPAGVAYNQNDHVNSGVGGIRVKPWKPVTISLSGELSRSDRPFTPIADRNFHSLNGRVQYKAKSLLLSAAYREQYNTNSITLSVHSSHARDYLFNASWSNKWVTFDAGYSKLHLDSVSGIDFFAASQFLQGLNSVYISNVHAGNVGARFVLSKRVDLYAGYTITRDAGDGRSTPAPVGVTDPTVLLLAPAQTFPLSFQSPQARLSVSLRQKLRWNLGWQLYNYHEDFQLFVVSQNYHAHTGFTSILWSF